METKKENDKFLPLKIICVIIVLGIVGYFVFNNSSQNSSSSDSTQSVTSTSQVPNNNTNLQQQQVLINKLGDIAQTANTETCKKFAQTDADSSGTSTSQYYSVQSYHYSTIDSACYFELHYQMNINYQGQTYVSQIYELHAVSEYEMNYDSKNNVTAEDSAKEAECDVPETSYVGATTDCKYYGLVSNTNNINQTFIGAKYGLHNNPPMSYSDYKTLVQKRMNN